MRRTAVIGCVILLYLGWVFATRSAGDKVRKSVPAYTARPAGLEITHFYTPAPTIMEGAKAVICYGTQDAVEVRLEPPVTSMYPSLNRCFDVRPERSTRYTLTALGKGGRTVSAAFDLAVTIDPDTLPRITEFSVCDTRSDRGQPVHRICFKTLNSVEIHIDPPVFASFRGVTGQFYVTPETTTTYTLTALDAKGRSASKSLTIELPRGGGPKLPLKLTTNIP